MRFGQGGRLDELYRLEDRDAALAGEFCRAHGRGHSLYALSLSHAMQVAVVRLNTRPRLPLTFDASRHPLASRAHDAPERLRLSAAGAPYQLSF